MEKGDFDNYSVEAFVPNACFLGISVPDTSTTTLTASTESGWWDLNARPVAVATALQRQLLEIRLVGFEPTACRRGDRVATAVARNRAGGI